MISGLSAEGYRPIWKSDPFKKGDLVRSVLGRPGADTKMGFIVREVKNPMNSGNRVFDVWWMGENKLQKEVWDYDLDLEVVVERD